MIFDNVKQLSPRRNTTQATSVESLVDEQLAHFGINADSSYGQSLSRTVTHLYHAQNDLTQLWKVTQETLADLPMEDKVAYCNAKKFLSFQIAKLLDNLQTPYRTVYQSLYQQGDEIGLNTHCALFDNLPALFSANPVIVKTATYVYACTEWVDDAFQGKESTHHIYSRLLNPTAISLSNAMVELEAGPHAGEYMAWNFNSGMAAIDALLGNILRTNDVLIVSRHVYGGVYQLLHDYYARPDRLNIALEWFEGESESDFSDFFVAVKKRYQDRLESSQLHVYLESPCNPHGHLVDVPAICRVAHQHGCLVALDSTLATPILHQPLQRKVAAERPDYVIHSYTKDICGTGTTTAGVVIGENHRMFQAKGGSAKGVEWNQTLFWDVFYIKGGFLDSEKAFDVLTGMKTLAQRVMTKSVNTMVLTEFLAAHPQITVHSHAFDEHPNAAMRKKLLKHGWPSGLFTIDLESLNLSEQAFRRFFDALEPRFSHQVSIGQSNTLILCPALTSHSELDKTALADSGIHATTMRIAVGTDNVKGLIAQLITAARLHIVPEISNFEAGFMAPEVIDDLVLRVSEQAIRDHYRSMPSMTQMLASDSVVV